MITHTARPLKVVLYEGKGAIPLPAEARLKVMTALLDKGYAVARVTTSGSQTSAPQDDHTLLLLGSFPERQAPALEDVTGRIQIEARDITDLDAESIVALVDKTRGQKPMNEPGKWKPWFPVIDYSRCTNCMQCLSFCLFDVYGVSEENKIQVQNNDNCKTNCPACSRVCPEVAIMFPKYQAGPINGDEVSATDHGREKMKVDISSLLGGDIYSALKDRSAAAKSRFSKERSPDKALDERKKCLTKLVSDGFIPMDVLASLPSPDEILRKSEIAKARAAAALAAQPGAQPAN
ncbi:Pyruvate/2-oxoacid:ferredoxin oxidoreductase delta subunit [Prosthecobacter fusiformis]|uniref:Pyruvate/2-oxoacid:ferredoxin oxidoreductase delta subunit n=1 Tax=Prosthecobacter fusiformis TaxID=48464 RepID=A0A4R7S492_9BACT|nr:ferredoxin family protein [Prosthecobacter fusiformis]TDU73232.1 Pyruvate/2-oxoacid:ferredoxin oxidoreductase delta subunit [Prosthecobacter fusiformis]